jgi:chromosomal replication initiator protein
MDPIKINKLLDEVAKVYDIDKDDITSMDRHRRPVEARHTAWYIMRYKLGYPLMKISAVFNRSHATIIHGTRHIQDLMDIDQTILPRHEYEKLLNYDPE